MSDSMEEARQIICLLAAYDPATQEAIAEARERGLTDLEIAARMESAARKISAKTQQEKP